MYYPPNHSDLSSSSISVPGTVHDLLSNYRSYSVQDWLQTLIKTAANDQTTPPLTYQVNRVMYYECRWDGVRHECLLVVIKAERSPAATPNTTSDPFADISDDLPAPNIPQTVGNEYYVRVSRSIDHLGISLPSWGDSRERLRYSGCTIKHSVISSPAVVTITSTIGGSRSCWHFENYQLHWKNSSSIKNTETIVALLRTAQRHEEVVAKVLAEADKDTERSPNQEGQCLTPVGLGETIDSEYTMTALFTPNRSMPRRQSA
ncbi:hypothetical protein BU15DRAFT_65652 [Melanogaster broomeanus]|nr:hypothetical protein BU15DRAFT_65652 [Melanogaster broomeanus]